MAKRLTDSVVSRLKPKLDQTGWLEVPDRNCRGLLLRLSPRGEKVWAVRFMVNGRRSRHAMGGYPTVSLSEARERTRRYRSASRDGESAEAVDARERARTMAVTDAYAEYVAALAGDKVIRASTKTLKEGMFEAHIKPTIGETRICSIHRAQVLEVVAGVADEDGNPLPVQKNRVFSEVMAFLRWCEQKGYVDGVPSIRKRDLRAFGAAKEQARRRTLTDAEICACWRVAGDLGDLSRDFMRLLLLTGQRRDEVRLMTWDEVDLDQALWTIPASRYKTRVDHAVPLSAAALDMIRARWTDGATGYVLAGRKDGKPFNGAASTVRRLRADLVKRAAFTLHDLRRTVRTGMARLGVDDETAELVIGHLPQGVRKVYDLYDRLSERRDALERWAQFVTNLQDTRSNVVALVKRA